MGSTSREVLHVSTENNGLCTSEKNKKRDLVRSASDRRERAVKSNPANSTRLRVLLKRFIYVNNGIAIKYSLRDYSH